MNLGLIITLYCELYLYNQKEYECLLIFIFMLDGKNYITIHIEYWNDQSIESAG